MTRKTCWISVLAFLLYSFTTSAIARTLEEVQALGAISMCANPDALPYSSNQPDALPGVQVEIGRAIAAGLGVSLNVDWIVPRRRAKVVNCDMLFDRVNDPAVYEGRLLLSRPYHRSGIAIALGREAQPLTDYSQLQKGQKIGVMISSMASVVLGKAGKSTSPYAFESDMFEDLLKDDLYGIATSSTMISYYIASNPGKGLQIAYAFDSVPSLTWEVSIGLRNSNQLLLGQINTLLDRLLEDGTITRIYSKYGIEHRQP